MTVPELLAAFSLGVRAWQEQLPQASNPYWTGNRRASAHAWLAGYHSEKAKSEGKG